MPVRKMSAEAEIEKSTNRRENVINRMKAKNSKEKRKILRFFSLLFFICMGSLAIMFLVEYVFYPHLNDWTLFVSGIPFVLGIAGSVIANYKTIMEHEEDDWTKNVKYVLKCVKKILVRNSVMVTLELLSIIIFLGLIGGQHQFLKRFNFASEVFVDKFMNYNEIAEGMQQKTKELSEAEREWVGSNVNETLTSASRIQMSEGEVCVIQELSREDLKEVFFLGGKFKIENWNSENEIRSKVKQKVEAYILVKEDNIFDKKAPDYFKEQVYQVSEMEKRADSLSLVTDILETRLIAYAEYPKRTLAKLISNDYQEIALAYYMNSGQEKTVLYNYGKSILFRMQMIKFSEETNETVKNNLAFIAQRYEDIVFTTSENVEERAYAEKLQKVFRVISAEY